MRLERYAIEPIERGAIVDGNVEKPEVVADALMRALRKAGTKTKTAALALPSSSVITKRITLPAGMRDDDYEMQVESEVRRSRRRTTSTSCWPLRARKRSTTGSWWPRWPDSSR